MRKFSMGIVCLIILFFLTGCGDKTVLTVDSFKSISEGSGYTVSDISGQYSSYDYIKDAFIARSSDGWQVEFYVLEDSDDASGMFNTNKANFEGYKSGVSSSSSVNMGNYDSYSLTSGGYYMYVCRVDNTLVYVREDDNYKDDIKGFIDKLGY